MLRRSLEPEQYTSLRYADRLDLARIAASVGSVGDRYEGVRGLEPSRIFSSHLPAATGASLERFLQLLDAVPDAEPFMPPDSEGFGQMVSAIAAGEPAHQPGAAT